MQLEQVGGIVRQVLGVAVLLSLDVSDGHDPLLLKQAESMNSSNKRPCQCFKTSLKNLY